MSGKGGMTSKPKRALKWMLSAQFSWLLALCALGAWWGWLVLSHAERIHDLETQLGLSSSTAESHWLRTQRMLFWEGSFFFGLLVLSGGVIFWVYWRDSKRQKGLQAFFASVTHELRTPLTSIRLQAESLQESFDPKKESGSSRVLTTRLLEDVLRLEGQVERTLELARVEGGGRVFTQSLRIKPWMERVLDTWRETYGDRLEVVSELEDLVVEADSSAIQVILRNLLENSIRHSRKDQVQVRVRSRREGAQVAVTFRDDGSRFEGDPTQLGRIFEKGVESQGAGVGLYLVRTLMERMGGRAAFQGTDGFEVTLWFQAAEVENG